MRDVVPIDRILHQRDATVDGWNRRRIDSQFPAGKRHDLLAPVSEEIGHLVHRAFRAGQARAIPLADLTTAVQLANQIAIPPDELVLRWNSAGNDLAVSRPPE